MSCKNIEDEIAAFLAKKGYSIQSGSQFPSTIDLIASKDDSVYIFEVKNYGTVSLPDLTRLKSLESNWNERLKADGTKTNTLIVTKGEVPADVTKTSGDLKIQVYNCSNVLDELRRIEQKKEKE